MAVATAGEDIAAELRALAEGFDDDDDHNHHDPAGDTGGGGGGRPYGEMARGGDGGGRALSTKQPPPSMYQQQASDERRRAAARERRHQPRPLRANGGLRLPAPVTSQPRATPTSRRPRSSSDNLVRHSRPTTAAPPAPLRPWRCNANVVRDVADPCVAVGGARGLDGSRACQRGKGVRHVGQARRASAGVSGRYPTFRDWLARQAKHDDEVRERVAQKARLERDARRWGGKTHASVVAWMGHV